MQIEMNETLWLLGRFLMGGLFVAGGIKHFFIEDESSRVNTQVPQTIAYLKSLKY